MPNNIKWGINRKTFKQLCQLHNKTFHPPHKIDHPDRCPSGPYHWHAYPIKNYDYRYNSWGYRGDDYEQHSGKSVNVCIGDSNTVNIGGPIDHSWPSLLSRYFEIPTLNFGIDSLCFYDFDALLNKCKKFFKVGKIFVLYNVFNYDQEPINGNVIPVSNSSKIDTKVNVLKKYAWIHDAYWQFDPPWQFFDDELSCLYEHFPEAHDYLKNVRLDHRSVDLCSLLSMTNLKKEYQKIAGTSWMPYEKFCEAYIIGTNVLDHFGVKMDKRLIKEFLSLHFLPTIKKMLLMNRDGWHMSKLVHKSLADYFYQQTTKSQ